MLQCSGSAFNPVFTVLFLHKVCINACMSCLVFFSVSHLCDIIISYQYATYFFVLWVNSLRGYSLLAFYTQVKKWEVNKSRLLEATAGLSGGTFWLLSLFEELWQEGFCSAASLLAAVRALPPFCFTYLLLLFYDHYYSRINNHDDHYHTSLTEPFCDYNF